MANAPASQKSLASVTLGNPGLYGSAVGKARYVPEGYRAPAQRLQFVIFGDRNGGERPGFMEQGVALTNLLRPEFVLSIGDQIPGYVKPGKGRTAEQAAARIRKQWVDLPPDTQHVPKPATSPPPAPANL